MGLVLASQNSTTVVVPVNVRIEWKDPLVIDVALDTLILLMDVKVRYFTIILKDFNFVG